MDYTAIRVKIVALRKERWALENKLMNNPKEMLAGSLVVKYAPCGKPNCRCKKKGSSGHGPYYYTQLKIKGSYRNVYIGNNKELIELARRYSEYIQNIAKLRRINKEIDQLLDKMNRSKIRGMK